MKLLPHAIKTGHSSHADLAAENTDEMHESRKRGGFGGAGQSARFERLQNDTAYQADVGAREPGRQEELHDLETASRPRSIEVRADPAAHRDDR